MTTPRRPRKCGRCTMFGHNRRSCHLSLDDHIAANIVYNMAMNNYQRHCYLNGQWVAAGGAGHTVPSPKMEDFIKKTPFEKACENKCKVIQEDTCWRKEYSNYALWSSISFWMPITALRFENIVSYL